jgi:oxygen-independent coproporphyrinogen-3 oxidase
MCAIDLTLLHKHNVPAPRYTSYPTPNNWEAFTPSQYIERLETLGLSDASLSLYVHIPFCKSMCLYCGCSVVLNRKPENEASYVDYLIKEIDLISSYLKRKKKVFQLHFGGGTPTQLSIPLLAALFEKLADAFDLTHAQEIAIEIDPRTVVEDQGAKLKFLKKLGFNRVSFGVQDTDPRVQEAIKRRQSLEVTNVTYHLARSLGFNGINIDLIYGLPLQTPASFDQTVSHILSLRPDRIAFFSYAKIPWLKPHQRAIKEATLPTLEEKFQIYASARARFIENGYVAIGMDHFALPADELAIAYKNKHLQRNFQGYSVKLAEDTIGLGVTAVGYVTGAYVQNLKDLPSYYHSLQHGKLPVSKGKMLSAEDHLRKWVIHTLMCDFELNKTQFLQRFGVSFADYSKPLKNPLDQLEAEGLILNLPDHLVVTPLGELFVRTIALTFDAYLKQERENQFSKAV